eukprot:COSAG06_NODE_7181_length_2595_cov_1.054087_2_plen_107_part_00
MCRGKKRADGRLAEEERQQQQEEKRQAEAERKAAKLQAYNDRKNQQRGGGAEAAHLSPMGKVLRVAEPRANSGRGTQVGRSLPQRVKQIEESQWRHRGPTDGRDIR